MKSSVWVVILLFVFGAGFLFIEAMQGGTSNVYTPEQLIALGPSTNLPRMRVVGRVASDENIRYSVQPAFELLFAITNPGHAPLATDKTVSVIYRDIKPDMFQAGRD